MGLVAPKQKHNPPRWIPDRPQIACQLHAPHCHFPVLFDFLLQLEGLGGSADAGGQNNGAVGKGMGLVSLCVGILETNNPIQTSGCGNSFMTGFTFAELQRAELFFLTTRKDVHTFGILFI